MWRVLVVVLTVELARMVAEDLQVLGVLPRHSCNVHDALAHGLHPTDTDEAQWQPEATRGNQWQSVATRGHHLEQTVRQTVRGHQWQSVAISGHQRQSPGTDRPTDMTPRHQWQSVAISGNHLEQTVRQT